MLSAPRFISALFQRKIGTVQQITKSEVSTVQKFALIVAQFFNNYSPGSFYSEIGAICSRSHIIIYFGSC